MRINRLSLDTILSALYQRAWVKKELAHCQARDLLRLIVSKLYYFSSGRLAEAAQVIDQGHLARRLGLSRRWVWELIHRLERAGYLRVVDQGYENSEKGLILRPRLYRIGPQVSKMLYAIQGWREKRSIKRLGNSSSHLVPLIRVKKEKPAPPEWQFEAGHSLFSNVQAFRRAISKKE